jgi:hypothetical protein
MNNCKVLVVMRYDTKMTESSLDAIHLIIVLHGFTPETGVARANMCHSRSAKEYRMHLGRRRGFPCLHVSSVGITGPQERFVALVHLSCECGLCSGRIWYRAKLRWCE